jgi:hypothetical protein
VTSLANELKRLNPEALERAAAYWSQQGEAESASYLARKQEQYPILDYLVGLTRRQHAAGGSIERFASWLQMFQYLISAAEEDPFDFDTFISYAASDTKVATELKDELEASGLRCFLAAKDIGAGTEWQGAIHAAMKGSRRVVLLVTPYSRDKPWLLLEAGAAWALDKPVFPALAYVRPEELVDPIRRFQARNVESKEDRQKFIEELRRG